MLGRLRAKADEAGLDIRAIHGDARETPLEGFDAVVERHLLWTVPGPEAMLEAWHRSAPHGRVVLLESLWGDAGGRPEQLRDIEWATRQALPSLADRLIGVAPHFAVIAGQG